MIMKNISLIVAMMIVFTGCKEKKVDSSSDESFKNTIVKLKKSLNAEEKRKFEDALKAIIMSEVGSIYEASLDPDGIERRVNDRLKGKTAYEIIAEGRRIMVCWREGIVTEISRLEIKQKNAELAKDKLKKLKILRSRFYYTKDPYLAEPTIELMVKNETVHAISRAYFEGILSTPGRAVPWIKHPFDYQIRGGLEPGELATWTITPNLYGEWGNAPKDRNDMVLAVTVSRIDGVNEKAIFNSEFSESDVERLQELKERLEELNRSLGK